MSAALDDLCRELGATPPPAFVTLQDEEIQALAAALAAARVHQRSALDEAIENGLGFVPRLLRGPVKKALFR